MRAINIRNVRADIVHAVDEDARRRKKSRNEVVVEILTVRYGLPVPDGGGRYQHGTSDQWLIRVPDSVYAAVTAHARQVNGTLPGCVMLAIAAEYRLPTVDPRKRGARSLTPEQETEARRRVNAGEISQRQLAKELGVTRKVIAAAVNR